MNIKAVFLHVMGDAMGSIIVMVAASLVRFTPVGTCVLFACMYVFLMTENSYSIHVSQFLT